MLGRRLAIGIGFCCCSATVTAQAPAVTRLEIRSRAEVIAGAGIMGSTAPGSPSGIGAAASAAVFPVDAVGVLAEVSSAAASCSDERGDPHACARTGIPGRAAAAGVKLRTPLMTNSGSGWRLFGQLLDGWRWTADGSLRVLQPGVGADDYLRNGLQLHVEYDFRLTLHAGRDEPRVGRYWIGLGLPLGSR